MYCHRREIPLPSLGSSSWRKYLRECMAFQFSLRCLSQSLPRRIGPSPPIMASTRSLAYLMSFIFYHYLPQNVWGFARVCLQADIGLSLNFFSDTMVMVAPVSSSISRGTLMGGVAPPLPIVCNVPVTFRVGHYKFRWMSIESYTFQFVVH